MMPLFLEGFIMKCIFLSSRIVVTAAAFGVSLGVAQAQVVAIGDSNVYGTGVSTAENYPTQLQAALNARGRNVTVTNAGWAGERSQGTLARIDSAVPDGTKLVVLWIGDNDIRRMPWPEIQKNIDQIQAKLRARGIAMYRVSLPPTWEIRKNPVNLSADQRHLSKEGYAAVVKMTLPAIERMLR
jgi:lysophospholipase L1-like esterase